MKMVFLFSLVFILIAICTDVQGLKCVICNENSCDSKKPVTCKKGDEDYCLRAERPKSKGAKSGQFCVPKEHGIWACKQLKQNLEKNEEQGVCYYCNTDGCNEFEQPPKDAEFVYVYRNNTQ